MTKPVAVIVHLSGELRGTTRRLRGQHLRFGTSGDAEIPLPQEGPAPLGAHHGTLSLIDGDYSLQVAEGYQVWVNGEPAHERTLSSGDLLEVGKDGPILRFRLYPPDSRAFKSLRDAYSDCIECVRRSGASPPVRAWIFIRGLVGELTRETTPRVRTAMAALLILLLTAIGLLAWQSAQLEQQLQIEARRVEGLAALLADSERESISPDQLDRLRSDLEQRLATTAGRLDYLEELADATERTIREAAQSIIFLQGSYGFRDSRTRQTLHYALSPDGHPVTDEQGNPRVTHNGTGPVVEAFFTGTAFVVGGEGLVLTNRHVALPWDFDEAAQQVLQQGLEPMMHRLWGYLPGVAEPFDVELVAASDNEDLAVLRCSAVTTGVRPLPLSTTPPRLGEAVIVMGFPTGIQAMMARADRAFLDGIEGERLDFWELVERLSVANQIGPLATRGIVGQVTESTIVYDADTTSGGSGGPVLTLDGRVVAINSAILPQFGGSNLGVPAERASRLLEQARASVETSRE